jgi:alanine-synthesizing transaminase
VFSHRLPWAANPNAISAAIVARRRAALPTLDLTLSNPTAAGFDYPDEALQSALARGARASYLPDPCGLLSAREAVAEWLSREGDEVSPDDLILTASTSEAYSYLFKLLCNPGDEVVTPKPSYPLLEHLSALELVELRHSQMEVVSSGGRRVWRQDPLSLTAHCSERTRVVVVVHPNNPTGNHLDSGEASALAGIAASLGAVVVSDEVFIDYPLSGERRRSLATHADVPTVALGGLSKSAALPHWKLGWIRIAGPEPMRSEMRRALELIADTYLSVATPVQSAVRDILALAPAIQEQISRRCRANLSTLRRFFSGGAVDLFEPEGGWTAVIRAPRLWTDEGLVLEILDETGVLLQPGYFYDFPMDGFLVLSLLPREVDFAEGVSRVATFLAERCR